MKIDPVMTLALGAVVAFLGRAAWDYFKSGRVEKGVYVKLTDCSQVRKECCVNQIKKEVTAAQAKIETHAVVLSNNEKRLDKGSDDFTVMRNDISDIKSDISGMRPLVEMMATHIKSKSKE